MRLSKGFDGQIRVLSRLMSKRIIYMNWKRPFLHGVVDLNESPASSGRVELSLLFIPGKTFI
jgi:hypothetical protein